MSRSAQRKVVYLAPTLAELDKRRPSSSLRLDRLESGPCDTASDVARNRITSPRKRVRKNNNASIGNATLLRTIDNITSSKGKVSFPEHLSTEISVLASVGKDSDDSCISEFWEAVGSDTGSLGNGSSQDGEKERRRRSQMTAFKAHEYRPLVTNPVSKSQRLRLGPARAVGLRRIRALPDRSPLLNEGASPSVNGASDKLRNPRPGPRPLSARGSTRDDTSLGGQTTVESIPPPPIHLFSLSKITPIVSILRSPDTYLSSYHGGNLESARKFNILALILRVGGMETCADWKAGAGKMMDRCEVVVKDLSGCSIKVVLEGECAAKWARFEPSPACDKSDTGTSMESTDASLLGASINEGQDMSTGLASRSTIEIQRMNQLYPLRPGDVVVMSSLLLSRPRIKRMGKRYIPSSDNKDSTSIHAVASPASEAQLELCWRSDVRKGQDARRNFDQSLTAFDARCKAIHRLAQLWS